jgi:hypothetical protein
MVWTRIVVLSDITTGKSDGWIDTHRHRDHARVKSIS